MFYTWDFMHKEISVTSKMFYFMVPPVYGSYGIYKGGQWINEIKATYEELKMVTGRG